MNIQKYLVPILFFLSGFMFVLTLRELVQGRWWWTIFDLFLVAVNFMNGCWQYRNHSKDQFQLGRIEGIIYIQSGAYYANLGSNAPLYQPEVNKPVPVPEEKKEDTATEKSHQGRMLRTEDLGGDNA